MAKNDGGSAFPGPFIDGGYDCGMSLRDYFASAALQGIEASQGNNGHFISTVEKVAARAYELADAMLAARNKK